MEQSSQISIFDTSEPPDISSPPSTTAAKQGSYIHHDDNGQPVFDLENIPQEALITSHNRKCIKTSALAYFSKVKKSSKV